MKEDGRKKWKKLKKLWKKSSVVKEEWSLEEREARV